MGRMRDLRWGFLAAAAILGMATEVDAKDWTKIKIATEGAYAPYNFTEAGGKLAGFEIDLAAELCKRMKAECEVVAQDWDGIIPALSANKYDAIMAGMNITAKRLEVLNFSLPYAAGPSSFVVLKSDPLAKTLPDFGKVFPLASDAAGAQKEIDALKPILKGKVVGVQVSTTQLAFLEKYLKDTVEIRTYKTTEQHDLDLAAGRVDATWGAISYFNTMLEKPEGKDMTLAGPGFVGGVLGDGVAVGLRKTDPELKVLFDGAIKSVIADGTLKTLSMKWFKVDMTPVS